MNLNLEQLKNIGIGIAICIGLFALAMIIN